MPQTTTTDDTTNAATEPMGTVVLTTHTDDSRTVVNVLRETPGDSDTAAGIPVEETEPDLGLRPGTAARVVALDVLEHVLDEEAWLKAMAGALKPGGTIVVRVPLEGPLAWLDALNMYRYAQDISGIGRNLEETKMKGWHRHYRRRELTQMFEDMGMHVSGVVRSGSPLLDVLQFGALVWGGMVRRDSEVEHRVRAWRDRIEAGHDLPRLGMLSTKVTVSGRTPATTPHGDRT